MYVNVNDRFVSYIYIVTRCISERSTMLNLSKLSLQSFEQLTPDARDDVYCLDRVSDVQTCNASIILFRGALQPSAQEIDELDAYLSNEDKVHPTPNKMSGFLKLPNGEFLIDSDNKYPLWRKERSKDGSLTGRVYQNSIKRIQGTFGIHYDFGQGSNTISKDEYWPALVRKALNITQTLAQSMGFDPSLYNGVHANLYKHGGVGLAAHSDNEPILLEGAPIFSFTILSGVIKPRPFSIYDAPQARGSKPIKRVDVVLNNGDLLIMQGDMQERYYHGIEEAKPFKQFEHSRRINLTVRAFKGDKKRKPNEFNQYLPKPP